MHVLKHSKPTQISTQTVHVLMMSSFAIRVHDADNDMQEAATGRETLLKSICDTFRESAAFQRLSFSLDQIG